MLHVGQDSRGAKVHRLALLQYLPALMTEKSQATHLTGNQRRLLMIFSQ